MKFAKQYLIAAIVSLVTVTGFINLNKFRVSENENTISSVRDYSRYARFSANDKNEINDFSIAAIVSNAVVHVWVKSKQENSDYFTESESNRYNVSGSGVIIGKEGIIITNNHVVKDALSITVTLTNRKSYNAELIGAYANNDLAVLKIHERNLPIISFGNSDIIHVGDWVLAIGYPWSLDETITAGIISAKSSKPDYVMKSNQLNSYIQTDAAINLGNSGGALVNTQGELIGINTAIISPTATSIGYGYAIPANTVYKITQNILKKLSVTRGSDF